MNRLLQSAPMSRARYRTRPAAAAHECGHAIAALELGLELVHARIEYRWTYWGGVTHFRPPTRGWPYAGEIMLTIAGPLAEAMSIGLPMVFAGDDLARLLADLAQRGEQASLLDFEEGAVFRLCASRAELCLRRRWPAFLELQERLAADQFVSGAAAAAIFERHRPAWGPGRESEITRTVPAGAGRPGSAGRDPHQTRSER